MVIGRYGRYGSYFWHESESEKFAKSDMPSRGTINHMGSFMQSKNSGIAGIVA